ncbi:MAG: DUF6591 domain-containing protein [Erysipelotrichaceae bacterium]|nr:DUF6591 domain-containing protein [Erysipelotrichaceae bacterium]
MKLIKMECPYCGAELQVEEGKKIVTCPYCGKNVAVDDEKKETIVTVKDEAKLQEASLKQQQYQDSLEEKKKEAVRAFRHTKGYKAIIFLMILAIIGGAAALFTGKTLALVIAIAQIVLLVLGLLSGEDRVAALAKVPEVIFIVLALVLAVPYATTVKAEKQEKLVWPDTELSARLPQPDSKYGYVITSDDEELDVVVQKFDGEQYQAYVRACKDKGFTVDAENDTGSYAAADQNGYILNVRQSSDSTVKIELTAPADYEEFTWPISDLAAKLPEPPVTRGNIQIDTSDRLIMTVPDMDEDAFKAYAAAVKDAGFDQDYRNDDDYFRGSSTDGVSVSLRREMGNVMEIDVQVEETPTVEATEEAAPTPTSTPAPTVEATPTPEATATAAASGIRPEFKEAMDSYAAFFDSYCDFMRSYDKSDLTMAVKYAEFMSKYADAMDKLNAVDESELTPEEDDYYIQTMAHINNSLAQLATEIN